MCRTRAYAAPEPEAFAFEGAREAENAVICGTSCAKPAGMEALTAEKPSEDAVRIARDLPYSPAEVQQLLDACDGDVSRGQFMARSAAILGWSIANTIRMQRMMAVRLAGILERATAHRKAS